MGMQTLFRTLGAEQEIPLDLLDLSSPIVIILRKYAICRLKKNALLKVKSYVLFARLSRASSSGGSISNNSERTSLKTQVRSQDI